ncbi:sialidase family protein [Fodinicola feengrottensis]|uniref:Exo-alpha-sialidase n=1 Tax=Fodinicola feengrottensis TaxID=435914 RepID=A0ABN2HA08_9ACTN|nr:sialidase family protein [Fodinicola feengrottensis]
MTTPADFVDVREKVDELGAFPDLASIHRKGLTRRRIRRQSWVLVPVAIVVVVALAAYAAPRLGSDTDRTLPPATAVWAPPTGTPPLLPPAVHGPLHGVKIPADQRMELMSSGTADEWRTYALTRTKDGKFALTRTLDGGYTWQAWTLPAEIPKLVNSVDGTPSEPAGPVAGDGQTVTIGDYVSLDGGQSWTRRSAPEATVDQVPSGWRAITYLHVTNGGTLGLAAQDPGSGARKPLAHQPPLQVVEDDNPGSWWQPGGHLRQAADGSLWTLVNKEVIRTSASKAPASHSSPAISHDAGRSWKLADQIPADIVDVDGRTAYAIGRTGAVYVSTDGGGSWDRVSAHGLPNRQIGGGALRSDGSLLVRAYAPGQPDDAQVWISKDGGQTFAQAIGAGHVQWLGDTAAGGVVANVRVEKDPDKQVPAVWLVSQDGLHWNAAPEPPAVYVVPSRGKTVGG